MLASGLLFRFMRPNNALLQLFVQEWDDDDVDDEEEDMFQIS